MSSRQAHSLPVFTPQRVAQGLRREGKASEQTKRLPAITVDVASVAKGAILVGQFLARRAAVKKARLQELRAEALELAEQFQGFLGIPDLMAGGRCSREEAANCFDLLENEQYCRFLCLYQEEALYVFPAFLTKVWSCDYCMSEFTVEKEHRKLTQCACPNCGATMRQRVAL